MIAVAESVVASVTMPPKPKYPALTRCLLSPPKLFPTGYKSIYALPCLWQIKLDEEIEIL